MRFTAHARFARRAFGIAGVLTLALSAQTVGNSDLPGVDLGSLNASQKATALKILREQGCTCGCSMKLAECRVKDSACTYSQGLASIIVANLKQGATEKDAIGAAAKSQFAHPPEPSNRLLDDPITIPTEGAPVLGPANAPITIVEFSDFQCPYCIAAVPNIEAVLKAYPKQVKLIFKQFPLEIHSDAAAAAIAALAAQQQGKFWPMHNALFAHHKDLSAAGIRSVAQSIGLDMQRFETDLRSPALQQIMQRDIADGDRAGVQGTPTIFINGQKFNGPIRLEVLKPVLDEELKQAKSGSQTASR